MHLHSFSSFGATFATQAPFALIVRFSNSHPNSWISIFCKINLFSCLYETSNFLLINFLSTWSPICGKCSSCFFLSFARIKFLCSDKTFLCRYAYTFSVVLAGGWYYWVILLFPCFCCLPFVLLFFFNVSFHFNWVCYLLGVDYLVIGSSKIIFVYWIWMVYSTFISSFSSQSVNMSSTPLNRHDLHHPKN